MQTPEVLVIAARSVETFGRWKSIPPGLADSPWALPFPEVTMIAAAAMMKLMERPVGGSVSKGESAKAAFASTAPASCKLNSPASSLEAVTSPVSHAMHLSFFPGRQCEEPAIGSSHQSALALWVAVAWP